MVLIEYNGCKQICSNGPFYWEDTPKDEDSLYNAVSAIVSEVDDPEVDDSNRYSPNEIRERAAWMAQNTSDKFAIRVRAFYMSSLEDKYSWLRENKKAANDLEYFRILWAEEILDGLEGDGAILQLLSESYFVLLIVLSDHCKPKNQKQTTNENTNQVGLIREYKGCFYPILLRQGDTGTFVLRRDWECIKKIEMLETEKPVAVEEKKGWYEWFGMGF